MQLQSNRVELGTRKKQKLEYNLHVTVPVEWTLLFLDGFNQSQPTPGRNYMERGFMVRTTCHF
jgi:hypothetical protein